MTFLVQQKTDYDCALASVAMAAGKQWDELWNEQDLKDLDGKGCGDITPYMERAGFERKTDYMTVYCADVINEHMSKLLLWRRAMLSVHSLNNEEGNHMVFWDGERVWDPQEGRPDKQYFRHLRSLVIDRVIVLR